MRTIIMVLFFLPIAATAQKQNIFLKLNDAAGKQINGDVIMRGYEKWVGVYTVSNSGKNNITVNFSMAINGVSADLKRMMANGELLSGQLNVTQTDPYSGRVGLLYTIKMEGIKVNACTDAVGCNNVMGTNAVITATRIGWTYYQTSPNGAQTVSRKYGYDANTGQEWTNF
jgi:type VI protein secretion system component Hcp